MKTKSEYAIEAIENAIDIFNRTKISTSKKKIAEALNTLHPDLFPTVDDARSLVRYILGSRGNKMKVGAELI